MKVIIPAKASSERVARKNWREFYNGDSLVDITISKLRDAGVPSGEIIVSCENEDLLQHVQKRHHVATALRSEKLCGNQVSLTTWIRSIVKQCKITGDVGWAQVCDPMFDDYDECFYVWSTAKKTYDSLVVAYETQQYLMMRSCGEMQPIGWSFGEHHTPSQYLPTLYTMPFTFSILSQESIAATGYHVGRKPYWFVCQTKHIDIDLPSDFATAQAMYSQRNV